MKGILAWDKEALHYDCTFLSFRKNIELNLSILFGQIIGITGLIIFNKQNRLFYSQGKHISSEEKLLCHTNKKYLIIFLHIFVLYI